MPLYIALATVGAGAPPLGAAAATAHTRAGWARGLATGARSPCRRRQPALQQVHPHRPFALHLDRSPLLKRIPVPKPLVGGLGHLDGAGHSVRFHPAGGVDGIAPEIVAELARADDARHHRPGVDPDP